MYVSWFNDEKRFKKIILKMYVDYMYLEDACLGGKQD